MAPLATDRFAVPRGLPIVPFRFTVALKAPENPELGLPARAKTSARSPFRTEALAESGALGVVFQFRSPTAASNWICMAARVMEPLETAAPELDAAASNARASKRLP